MEELGSSAARGHGKGNGFKPGGGYYPKPVKVHLRAYKVGTCGHSERSAYTKMQAQFEKKPGSGKFGKWLAWGGRSRSASSSSRAERRLADVTAGRSL